MINNITYYGEIPESFYSFADGLTDLQKAEIRESFVMTVQVSRRYCVFYARDFYFLIYASGEIELMRPGFTKVSVADLLAQGQETFRVCARPGTVDVSLSYLDILEVQSNFDSQLILDNLVLVLDELKKKLASLGLMDSTIQSAVESAVNLIGLEVDARNSAIGLESSARASAVASLTTLVNGKAPTVHTHSYSVLPVDNNDASMPTVGIGGFSYAYSSCGIGNFPLLTIGSGGTWVYVSQYYDASTPDSPVTKVGRVAGGTSVYGLISSNGNGFLHVVAWRIA